MNYQYTAIQRDSRLVKGAMEATDEGMVDERLAQAGMRAVTIRPALRPKLFLGLTESSKVSKKELAFFSRQLSTLIDSGIPLLTGIHLLRDQGRTQAFRQLLDNLEAELRAGSSLHQAMKKYPRAFPEVYVHLVGAGEGSGTLDRTLAHLAVYLQKEIALVQQAKKALTYPAITAIVGVVVMGVLVTFVLPTLTALLVSFKADLPLITRVVIGASDAVQKFKLPGMLALLVGGAFAVWHFRKPAGKLQLHRFFITAPVLGRLTVQGNVARFSRTMSMLVGAGLPLPESLKLAGDSASNLVFRNAVLEAKKQVLQGKSLAQSIGAIPFVPGLYSQMLRIGEESGALEGNLSSMADFYEREVEEQLAMLTSLLEPAMTVGLGLVVAVIAMALLLPMLSILNTVAGT